MLIRENINSKLVVDSDGTICFWDMTTNKSWSFNNTGWITFEDGTKETLGNAELEEMASGVKMHFESEGEYPFVVETELKLMDDCLEIIILKIQGTQYESVEYPAHLFNFESGASDSYITVPYKQGLIIPGRLDAGFMRYMHNTWANISDINTTIPFESYKLNMTWFGAKNNDSSIFAYMDTPEDASLHIIGNAVVDENEEVVDSHQGIIPGTRICSLTPVWNASRRNFGYKRKLKVEILKNGYVGMTKRYRELAIETGRFKSLQDKIQENPEIAKLIGAPDIKIYIYTNRPNMPFYRSWSEPILNGYTRVHTTFKQVEEMAESLRDVGIENALVLLGGWNRMGYDREHIDMLPAAAPAGGTEGLAKAAKKVIDLGYIFALHDNYQDIYLDSPSYDEKLVMKHPDGTVKLGGVWDGGLCRLVCSETSLELIRKTVEELLEDVPVSSYYLDTITSALLYECYDEEHPLTRSDDKTMKLRVLEYLKSKNLIIGGEAGIDWATSHCPYFEGLPGDAYGYFSGIDSPGFGIATPLFNLVYHDSVICYWQHGQPFGREDHENHLLHDLLSGQPSSWSLVYDQWEDLLPMIKQCYDLLGKLHKQTAFSELIVHNFLTEDFAVQESLFGDNTRVQVNYGITTYHCEEYSIPPKGFRLSIVGEGVISGNFSRLAQINK
ncbi:MAG: DUF5696 domain-containing protein [Eubacteriales bacterium]